MNQDFSAKNKNKFKIIIIILVVAIILIVGMLLLKNKGNSISSSGYTVNNNETLKIKEMDGKYDFSINVLSVEKNHYVNNYLYNGDCYALKVKINNDSSSDLSLLSFIKFSLVNSSDEEIADYNGLLSSYFDGSLTDNIISGKTETGYLYFYNIDNNDNISNVNSTDVAKLKISVPKELSKTNSTISGNYNYYYINLK